MYQALKYRSLVNSTSTLEDSTGTRRMMPQTSVILKWLDTIDRQGNYCTGSSFDFTNSELVDFFIKGNSTLELILPYMIDLYAL